MRPIHLATLFSIGCITYDLKPTNNLPADLYDGLAPDINVTPLSIDFGEHNVGTPTSAVETVLVENLGNAPLEIREIRLEDATQPYEFGLVGTVLVPEGGNTTFTVTFAPQTAGEYTTRVLIDSNDPDEPDVPVDLTGVGVAPAIQIDPAVYDFGTQYIGCDLESPLTISNVGNADLEISDYRYITASNDLSFEDNEGVNGAPPWTLAPFESMEVFVDYYPLDDYADEGYLTLSSNDPLQPEAQARQSGQGVLYGRQLDLFEQPSQGATDILFVIDNSGSMGNEQTSLADNFAYFAAGLVELDLDFQIAVITTDDPDHQGALITPSTPDIEAEFIAQATVGINGSGDEMPSEMAYQCTQPGYDCGPGSEFLRDTALLSMIFISDEPDSSPSDWTDYLAYFQSLKSDSDDYIAHAISGDWPSGCSGSSATNNVYEMTVATGGLYLSVCATDWASHLEALVEGSAQDLSQFDLTAWPVPETIEVRIDGISTTVGWSYDGADRAVVFEDSAIPEGGSTIEVEYALYGDCSG